MRSASVLQLLPQRSAVETQDPCVRRCRRLSSRIDGVASKLKSIQAQRGVRHTANQTIPATLRILAVRHVHADWVRFRIAGCQIDGGNQPAAGPGDGSDGHYGGRYPASTLSCNASVRTVTLTPVFWQIAQSMDAFEKQLNDLDMQGTMINSTMAMGATSTPVDEVDALISQVADENALDLSEKYGPPTCHPFVTHAHACLGSSTCCHAEFVGVSCHDRAVCAPAGSPMRREGWLLRLQPQHRSRYRRSSLTVG